jgi:hypothetical protein
MGSDPVSDKPTTTSVVVKPTTNTRDNLRPVPWKKGQSGNRTGRPKSLPRFRKGCRNDSFKIKRAIMKDIDSPDVPLGEKVKAFEAICDRGGFLVADKEVSLEIAKAQLLVAAAAARAKFATEAEFLRFVAEMQEPGKGQAMLDAAKPAQQESQDEQTKETEDGGS